MKKQFKLKDWLRDKSQKVVTRYGDPVRILCWDKKDKTYPILALVEENDDEELDCSYTINGTYFEKEKSGYDLFIETDESEDERIKNRILDVLQDCANIDIVHEEEHQHMINWIKRQSGKPTDPINGEDYGIDGIYHAIEILRKTIGAVEGYQSDDGILEHKIALETVKNLKDLPKWEVDENARKSKAIYVFSDTEYLYWNGYKIKIKDLWNKLK